MTGIMLGRGLRRPNDIRIILMAHIKRNAIVVGIGLMKRTLRLLSDDSIGNYRGLVVKRPLC